MKTIYQFIQGKQFLFWWIVVATEGNGNEADKFVKEHLQLLYWLLIPTIPVQTRTTNIRVTMILSACGYCGRFCAVTWLMNNSVVQCYSHISWIITPSLKLDKVVYRIFGLITLYTSYYRVVQSRDQKWSRLTDKISLRGHTQMTSHLREVSV